MIKGEQRIICTNIHSKQQWGKLGIHRLGVVDRSETYHIIHHHSPQPVDDKRTPKISRTERDDGSIRFCESTKTKIISHILSRKTIQGKSI